MQSTATIDEADAGGSYRRMMSLPKSAKTDLAKIRSRRGLTSDTKAVAVALETAAKLTDVSTEEAAAAIQLWRLIKDLKEEEPAGKLRFIVEAIRPGENAPVVTRLAVPGL